LRLFLRLLGWSCIFKFFCGFDEAVPEAVLEAVPEAVPKAVRVEFHF
jgi:hypothetical protein